MKNFRKILASELFTGSTVMLIGVNSANFLAYIYHLFFGRILGPALYGELASVLSLVSLVTSFFGFIGTAVVRFAAVESKAGINNLYMWLRGLILKVGIPLVLILMIISPFIAKSISTELTISIQVGPLILFMFLVNFYSSFLQGILKFNQVIYVSIINWVVRLALGYVLYLAGLSLPGIVLAVLISMAAASFVGRFFMGFHHIPKVESYEKKQEFLKYSLPVFVMTLAVGSFLSTDVVLVRHFLSAQDSGFYAALVTLGKIVIYACAPISVVMFPLVSKSYSKGEKTRHLLFLSGLATLVICTGIIVFYAIFPNLAVGILYGSKYLAITADLARVGILYLIFSLDLLLTNYFLSKSRTLPAYFMAFAALIQAGGIFMFHESILMVINVSIFSALLLLMALSIWSVANFLED